MKTGIWEATNLDEESIWLTKGGETYLADANELDPMFDLFFDTQLGAGRLKKVNKAGNSGK